VLGHRILRMVAGATATSNFFMSALVAIEVVFLVRQVGLSPGPIGVLTSIGAVGGVIGAVGATRLTRQLGTARVIWLSSAITSPFALLLPLTFPGVGLAFYASGTFALYLGTVVYNISAGSFRQGICPDRLLGRVGATMRFLVWGTLPLGGLAGGVLGGWLGNRDGLWVAVIGIAAAPLWLLLSPLRAMRDFLPPATDTEAASPTRPPSTAVTSE
jgi:MFS family permease